MHTHTHMYTCIHTQHTHMNTHTLPPPPSKINRRRLNHNINLRQARTQHIENWSCLLGHVELQGNLEKDKGNVVVMLGVRHLNFVGDVSPGD